MKLFRTIFFAALLALSSCMDYGPVDEEEFYASGDGLFIVNEGNFMYGNASLSYYDPITKKVENEIFARSNGFKLGDVAQSMTIWDSLGWTVVNNSGVIFAIDLNTFKEEGRITGFTSPRHIHFISRQKAYVTQLWDPRIYVVNPITSQITGYVTTDMDYDTGSTEMMVQYGKYLFTNCWSYQNRILKIDTETDKVVGQLTVGIQPSCILLDANGKLWTLTDGGVKGASFGNEAPALYCIDAESFKIERVFNFTIEDTPLSLTLSGDGETLFWLNGDVWSMDVNATHLPVKQLFESSSTRCYAMTVSPVNGEIYVADAIDYVQNGVIMRYSPEGELIDRFNVGICPGAFCWR